MIERADRILDTLAHLAATRTGSDGATLRHALYAALLASALNLSPADADDRAADPAWSDAERAVNERARELIEQASTAVWTPKPGDVVIRTGHTGKWIVRGWEDDDFVWVHRPGTATVPTYGRTIGYTDLAPGQRQPARKELVAIAELRPAEQAVAVTR